MKVTAKRKSGASVEAEYDFGANLKEMVEKFGEEVVFNHAQGDVKVAFHAWLPSQPDQGESQADITAGAKTWSALATTPALLTVIVRLPWSQLSTPAVARIPPGWERIFIARPNCSCGKLATMWSM